MAPKRPLDPSTTTTSTASAPPHKKEKATHPFFAAATNQKPATGHITWKVEGNGSLLVGKHLDQTATSKIAAFDFDDTITFTKGTHVFSKTPQDWRFVHPTNTREKILQHYNDGFRIIIISNQKNLLESAGKKGGSHTKEEIFKGKVAEVAGSLGIPLLILAALDESHFRKPQTGMWEYLVSHCNDNIAPDLSVSFYVGDAAGRPERTEKGKPVKKDHSAGDYRLALNLGIKFYIPETFYDIDHNAIQHLPQKWDFDPLHFEFNAELYTPSATPLIPENLEGPELILLVGPPASGKTSFTKKHLLPHGYIHVNQDTLKDRKKCLQVTLESLESGKSVVVDNTNPTAAVRKEYITVAQKAGIQHIRCFYFTASIELCEHNNLVRVVQTKGLGKGVERGKIPTMVFRTFSKNLEVPDAEKEGFVEEVKKIQFVPDFKDDQEKALWSKWYL
ncbi:polynucleotide kinase 3 phosphatase-domain-containing protein [Obelidium mucronatum]|nr:polynucleotide kinase 3 phosphatase-domain-containing protein [Obelidium mucronatum]